MIRRSLKTALRTVRTWRDRVREQKARWLDEVGKLPELTDAERAHLAGGELYTRTALAARVARDGLETTARTGIDPVRLRDALASYSLAEVKGKTRPFPVRALRQVFINWREIVLLAALVLLAAGIRRAAGHPERVVEATRDLSPFHVIGPGDVTERRTEAGFGVYASPGDVVGRFPLQAIVAGAPLARDRLSRVRFERPAELQGRRVVALPVTRQSAALAVPGSRVFLLLSPTQGGETKSHVLKDVIVLNARAAGDTSSMVVAMTGSDFDAMGPLLGRSLVTVVQEPVVESP